jgi:hypothetical protein
MKPAQRQPTSNLTLGLIWLSLAAYALLSLAIFGKGCS